VRKSLSAFLLILCASGLSYGQHGTAENGYFPTSYMGDIWTGVLTAGDGPERELKPSNVPKGTKLTVFYYTDTEKVQDKKIQVHTIFLIKGIANLRQRPTRFKVF